MQYNSWKSFGWIVWSVVIQVIKKVIHFLFYLDGNVMIQGDVMLSLDHGTGKDSETKESENDRKDIHENNRLQENPGFVQFIILNFFSPLRWIRAWKS